ncbi:MAG: hypothetical protein WBG92_17810, partial [Thiohalocapsa sp.]
CLASPAPCLLVCEGPNSEFLFAQFPNLAPLIDRIGGSLIGVIGDWRPPEVWVHDTEEAEPNQERVPVDDPRLQFTLGLRAAGAHDGVVFMGGPTIIGIGLQLFAFDAQTKELIGARTFPQYSNVRRFIEVGNHLYVGVQNTAGGGSVLRWKGSRSQPFNFETVGKLDNEVAYLAVFDDRLLATTWTPTPLSSAAGLADGSGLSSPGLWVSPRIPSFGLRWWHSKWWSKIWDLSDYEPDPVIAAWSGLGDLRQFGDCVYFGSMHPPFSGFTGLTREYGTSTDPAALEQAQQNSRRALAFFRGCKSRRGPYFELLYGEEELPVFVATPNGAPGEGSWVLTATGMGPPVFGGSGFNNTGNPDDPDSRAQIYTWSMGFLDGQLCVGTQENTDSASTPPSKPGADLWCFPDSFSPAAALDQEGLGNSANSGYRNIERIGESLYLATSNGQNLSNFPFPIGGFEVIRLDPPVSP